MKIGIVADTHDNIPKIEKAIKLLKNNKVGFVFHCGDIISPFSAKRFSEFGSKFIGVFGNNDGDKWLLSKVIKNFGGIIEEGPVRVSIENKKILLLHGYRDIDMTLELVNSLAEREIYDIILYGHTHERDIRKVKKTIIINPGETCGYLTNKSTIVVLDLKTMEPQTLEF